jgi:PTH1 family peptidyl-tRNA hydrolase
MKVVVGLGNPGDKYALTKHNVGFWVIDLLSRRFGIACRKEKFKALIGEGFVDGEKVLLCKPMTFMNLSGESLSEILSFYRELRPEEDIIVIYDDMDFAPGQLRLREKGSAGGHNGMKSVIQHLGTEVFPRIRIGIGRPPAEQTVVEHVLSPFAADDLRAVQSAVETAAEAVAYALANDFRAAMNRFNARR